MPDTVASTTSTSHQPSLYNRMKRYFADIFTKPTNIAARKILTALPPALPTDDRLLCPANDIASRNQNPRQNQMSELENLNRDNCGSTHSSPGNGCDVSDSASSLSSPDHNSKISDSRIDGVDTSVSIDSNVSVDQSNLSTSDNKIIGTNKRWYSTVLQDFFAECATVTEFNHDGSYLAFGNKTGRITIYKRKEERKRNAISYERQLTFVSHVSEFDYLKSMEIEEKINKIKFLSSMRPFNYLLSTNDKTIKLWKIHEQWKYCVQPLRECGEDDLCLPRVVTFRTPIFRSIAKAVYKNGHTYHVNSISPSSDGETFISADDLRINLWNFEVQNQLYNIVDIKPANMEDVTEVITCAEFHPIVCSLFAYTSSKGCVRLCDLRTSALCDQCYTLYEIKDDPLARSFFSEIISSISQIRFSNCGKYMLTRDYMSLKVWDCRMTSKPAEQYLLHPHVKSRMCAMYENDYIFDKFDCSWSGDDSKILTGSYGNLFTIVNRHDQKMDIYQASNSNSSSELLLSEPLKFRDVTSLTTGNNSVNGLSTSTYSNSQELLDRETFFDDLDYSKRILHCAWSPDSQCISIAAESSSLFFTRKSTTNADQEEDNGDGIESGQQSQKNEDDSDQMDLDDSIIDESDDASQDAASEVVDIMECK